MWKTDNGKSIYAFSKSRIGTSGEVTGKYIKENIYYREEENLNLPFKTYVYLAVPIIEY